MLTLNIAQIKLQKCKANCKTGPQAAMIQWDDFRFFIAAARSGSFSDAAPLTGADVATVSRRVARLETALKATLFVRSSTGLKLTAIGRNVLSECENIETLVSRLHEPVAQKLIAGTVRISASEGFGNIILAPLIPTLIEENPALSIELAANSGFLSPSIREVDIAVTLSADVDSRLIVEPLTTYRLGLYSSADYLKRCGKPRKIDDLLDHRIVGYVDDLLYAPELRYLEEIRPGLKPSLASTSINAQREIILHGGGIGILPKFIAGGLTRLFPQKISLERRFWIATHRDVAETARIRHVKKWMHNVVETSAAALR